MLHRNTAPRQILFILFFAITLGVGWNMIRASHERYIVWIHKCSVYMSWIHHIWSDVTVIIRYSADARFVPSQWETSLQSNTVSHWLGANLASALRYIRPHIQTPIYENRKYNQNAHMNFVIIVSYFVLVLLVSVRPNGIFITRLFVIADDYQIFRQLQLKKCYIWDEYHCTLWCNLICNRIYCR